MKTVAEQFEIDFVKLESERQLFEMYEQRQAADAKNWTEEAMAMVWFLGMQDWETWQNLPQYQRSQVVESYRYEQLLLSWHPERRRIRSYREACPGVPKEVLADRIACAQRMAQQLSADWSANRPPSVFTYDSGIAAMVSARLGRTIEAVKPEDRLWERYP